MQSQKHFNTVEITAGGDVPFQCSYIVVKQLNVFQPSETSVSVFGVSAATWLNTCFFS